MHTDLQAPVRELLAHPLALFTGGDRIDIPGRDSSLGELGLQVLGMGAVDGEQRVERFWARFSQVSTTSATSVPSRDLAKITLVVVTGHRTHPRQIGITRANTRKRDRYPASINSAVVAAIMRSSKCLPRPRLHGVAESPMKGRSAQAGFCIEVP